jgi:hypothetical protein
MPSVRIDKRGAELSRNFGLCYFMELNSFFYVSMSQFLSNISVMKTFSRASMSNLMDRIVQSMENMQISGFNDSEMLSRVSLYKFCLLFCIAYKWLRWC